jgi:uncharacterized protein (DUF433 family)
MARAEDRGSDRFEAIAMNDTPVTQDDIIFNRGRGPEIRGTRITVYCILDYLLLGWHHTQIAATLRISSREVQAAMDYIVEHTLEVMREYVKILERAARGNPPELQAKLDARHAEFLELVARVRGLEEADPAVRQQKVSAMIREYREQGVRSHADARDNGR